MLLILGLFDRDDIFGNHSWRGCSSNFPRHPLRNPAQLTRTSEVHWGSRCHKRAPFSKCCFLGEAERYRVLGILTPISTYGVGNHLAYSLLIPMKTRLNKITEIEERTSPTNSVIRHGQAYLGALEMLYNCV